MGSFSTIGATKLLFEYTIDELARKFNQAEPAVAASYFDNLFNTLAIAKILDNTNLSIQKGQEIVDAMSDPSKIGTGGRRGYLGDDWQDNKITDRDDAATTSTALGRIFQIFRPEWSGGLAEDGVFKLTGTDEKQYCSSNFTTGYWYVKWYSTGSSGSWGMRFYFMWVDNNNHYFLDYRGDLPDLSLKKTVGGSTSTLISKTDVEPAANYWNDAKVKRDDDGNFEAWHGYISLGTCVDTSITSSNRLYLGCIGDVDTYFDNLQVY